MHENADIFETRLDEALQALQSCQNDRSVESCYACVEAVGCDVRNKYVRTVYESMSKGETGGFDF